MTVSFDVHFGASRQTVTSDELDELAIAYGLDRIARGRYSALFVLNLLLLERVDGIPHHFVVSEIEALEGLGPATYWKQKIEGNRKRDQRNFRKLRRLGWIVLRLWEHDVARNPDSCVDLIEAAVRRSGRLPGGCASSVPSAHRWTSARNS